MGTFVLRITGAVVTVFDTLNSPTQAVALVPNLVSLVGKSPVPTSPISRDVADRPLFSRPHLAFLRYPSALPTAQVEPIHPPPGGMPSSTLLHYLNRHRVSFTFRGTPSPDPFEAATLRDAPGRAWESYPSDSLTSDELLQDLSNLADLSKITGRLIDPAHLAVHPSAKVLAQVMIGSFGRLTAFPPENNLHWKLHALSRERGPIERPLSHAMLWQVEGVDEVEVHFTPLDPPNGSAPMGRCSFRLAVADTHPLVVTLANLCIDNALEWTVDHDTTVDLDMLWSFALLDNSDDIADTAREIGLEPRLLAPHPVLPEGGGSSGSNCRDQIACTRCSAVAHLFDSIRY